MTSFNSFASVEIAYNNTKPVVSKNFSPEDDCRPIGKRRRVHERIVKINRNCYVLSQQDWLGGDKQTHAEFLKGVAKSATSIKWQRNTDNTETVTIRAPREKHATGSLAFLSRHTPWVVCFFSYRGKCKVSVARKEYNLPHSRVIPGNTAARMSVYVKRGIYTTRDDGNYLSFTRPTGASGEWKLSSKKHRNTVTRRRVDKKHKAGLAPAIAQFKEWAKVMYPLIAGDIAARKHKINRQAYETIAEHCGLDKISGWSVPFRKENTLHKEYDEQKLVLEIMKNPEHPLRVILLDGLAFYCSGSHLWNGGDKERWIATPFNTHFNNWVNKVLGLTKNVEVEVEQ